MKSKISEYILQVLTIIIGVLIAFYLTQYGERTNKNQNEKDVLNQLYLELKDNLDDLENDFQLHKVGLFGNLRAIQFYDKKEPLTDSLIMDLYWMSRDEYIFPSTSGYENLKSFGLNLIKDDTLREQITIIYNHDFPRLTTGNTFYPDINEYLTPYFKEHFQLNTDTTLQYTLTLNDSAAITYPLELVPGFYQTIGYIPKSTAALQNSSEFRFLIGKTLEYRLYKYSYYQKTINNVKDALERIEQIN